MLVEPFLDFEDSIYHMLVSYSDSFIDWSEREGSLVNPGHREIGSGWSCGALVSVLKAKQENHNAKHWENHDPVSKIMFLA